MAVTKIWDVRGRLDSPLKYIENPEKTENLNFGDNIGKGARSVNAELQALTDVIEYAANEDKTERRFYVSGINCNITCARQQFITVKQTFDKEDGIIAYHAYQSFAPGETTPEQAHEIGKKLAKRLWGKNYQVVVATHINSHCLHNHFIVNSVSFRDGKRYHDCRSTYRELRETSDQLCREYGLSVVEKPHRKETEPLWIAQASKAGMPTRYNLAREAIDEAISKSTNIREFENHLRSLGYSTQFNPKRKYWTITPKGWKQAIRLARLGDDYTNNRIYERLIENNRNQYMYDFQKGSYRKSGSRQYRLGTRRDKLRRYKGLRGLYLRYCYELGYLPKYTQRPNRVHYLLKDDLLMADKISEQTILLGKYEIETMDELEDVMSKVTDKKELRLLKDIKARSEYYRDKLEAVENDRQEKEERTCTEMQQNRL